MGGQTTPASGALAGAKGDLVWDAFLLESKATSGASLRLLYSWLVKITNEAQARGKHPALTVQFIEGEAGHSRVDGDWVMIPRWVFEERFRGLDEEPGAE